jgi:hypothetical protein
MERQRNRRPESTERRSSQTESSGGLINNCSENPEFRRRGDAQSECGITRREPGARAIMRVRVIGAVKSRKAEKPGAGFGAIGANAD